MNISISNESWEKLPERIKPLLTFDQFILKIAIFMLVFLSLACMAPMIFFTLISNKSTLATLAWLGAFAVLGALLFYVAYGQVKGFFDNLSWRKQFLQSQSHTIAQILNRRVVKREAGYNVTYTYYLQLEITPTLAPVNTGTLRLEAQVNKKLFESLLNSKTVNVIYATQDPRIFIIEGE